MLVHSRVSQLLGNHRNMRILVVSMELVAVFLFTFAPINVFISSTVHSPYAVNTEKEFPLLEMKKLQSIWAQILVQILIYLCEWEQNGFSIEY